MTAPTRTTAPGKTAAGLTAAFWGFNGCLVALAVLFAAAVLVGTDFAVAVEQLLVQEGTSVT